MVLRRTSLHLFRISVHPPIPSSFSFWTSSSCIESEYVCVPTLPWCWCQPSPASYGWRGGILMHGAYGPDTPLLFTELWQQQQNQWQRKQQQWHHSSCDNWRLPSRLFPSPSHWMAPFQEGGSEEIILRPASSLSGSSFFSCRAANSAY